MFLEQRCSHTRRAGESDHVTDNDAFLTLQILHQTNLVHVDSAMLRGHETDYVARPVCVSLALVSALFVLTDHSRSNAHVVVSVPASTAAPYKIPNCTLGHRA